MSKKLNILANFNEDYGLHEWVKDNIQVLNKKTGLKLLPETIIDIHDGFLIKNEILEQTFFVKCDDQKSTEYDLGAILTECGAQKPEGVIWLANNPPDELKNAFNWLNQTTEKDFEMYLIEIQIINKIK